MAVLRRLLRRQIQKVAAGEAPSTSPVRSNGTVPTYCHDTVLTVPGQRGAADDALLEKAASLVTDIVIKGAHQVSPRREDDIRDLLFQLQGELAAAGVEMPEPAFALGES